jgi:hypothetical protein
MMVKELPKNVQDLFNDPQAVKVLATASSNGVLHVIPLGSMSAPEPGKVVFAKIMAKEASSNLQDGLKKGAFVSTLAVKGGQAFQVRCKAKEFDAAGPLFLKLSEAYKAKGLTVQGVWILEPFEVLNQSPGPDAGKLM